MDIINRRKFLLFCFIDIVLFAIINEKHKHLSFYLLLPLFFISYILSFEKKVIIEKEYHPPVDKPKITKNKQAKEKNYTFSNYLKSISYAPISKTKNTQPVEIEYVYEEDEEDEEEEEEEDYTEDVFDPSENSFYKNIDKSQKFPSFSQLKSTHGSNFVRPKQKYLHINLNNVRTDQPTTQKWKPKKIIKRSTKFSKQKEITDLIISIRNNIDNIKSKGSEIRKVLQTQKNEYEYGLYFLTCQIKSFIVENSGDRRVSIFGMALSCVVPKDDPFREYFECCMYEQCEQGNPYTKPATPSNPRNSIWDKASLKVFPASILFCYWCFIDEVEMLFKWLDNHSKFDDDIDYPDISIGITFYNLIKFAGKKLYDTDKTRVLKMIDEALQFFSYYTQPKNEVEKLNKIKMFYADLNWPDAYTNAFIGFYANVPKFYEEFKIAVKNDNIDKLKEKYDNYQSLLESSN